MVCNPRGLFKSPGTALKHTGTVGRFSRWLRAASTGHPLLFLNSGCPCWEIFTLRSERRCLGEQHTERPKGGVEGPKHPAPNSTRIALLLFVWHRGCQAVVCLAGCMFFNKVLLEHSHVHSLDTVYNWTTMAELSSWKRNLQAPQSLPNLLSGSLEKSFADPWFNLLEFCRRFLLK